MRSILLAVGLLIVTPAVCRAQFYAPYASWGTRNSIKTTRGTIRVDQSVQKQRVTDENSRSLETFQVGDTTYSGLRGRDRQQTATFRSNFNGDGTITGWEIVNKPDAYGYAGVDAVPLEDEALPLGGEELKLNYDFEGL